jgi:hypothetical protein
MNKEVYGRLQEKSRDSNHDGSSSSYGHVILTPQEARKQLPVGSFGEVVETPVYVTQPTNFEQQQDQPAPSSKVNQPKVIVISDSSKGRKSKSSSRKTTGRTGPQERSKSSLTADEFFNGRWHEDPVMY